MNYQEIGKQAIYKYRALNYCKLSASPPSPPPKSCGHLEEIISLKSEIHHLTQVNSALSSKLQTISSQPHLQITIADPEKLLTNDWSSELITELTKELFHISLS